MFQENLENLYTLIDNEECRVHTAGEEARIQYDYKYMYTSNSCIHLLQMTPFYVHNAKVDVANLSELTSSPCLQTSDFASEG